MDDPELDSMLRMYGWLRDEITQSNQLQHRIVLGLSTFVGTVFGLTFSGALANVSRLGTGAFELVIAAVLPIVVMAGGIWLVEQSRVMMAGNYLQLLEYKINERTDGAPMSWENWLRRDPADLPAQHRIPDDWYDPQAVYDRAYLLGYVGFFAVVGGLSLLLYAGVVLGVGPGDARSLAAATAAIERLLGTPLAVLYFLVWLGLLAAFVYYAVRVISHSGHSMTEHVIRGWEANEFDVGRDPPLSRALERHGDRLTDLGIPTDADAEDRFESLVERANDRGAD